MAQKPLPELFEPWRAVQSRSWERAFPPGGDVFDDPDERLTWLAKRDKARDNAEIMICGSDMHEPSVNTSLLGSTSYNDGSGILMTLRPVHAEADNAATHAQIAERLVECVNALAGVLDPARFMEDIRSILADAPREDVRVVRCLCRLDGARPKRILDTDA